MRKDHRIKIRPPNGLGMLINVLPRGKTAVRRSGHEWREKSPSRPQGELGSLPSSRRRGSGGLLSNAQFTDDIEISLRVLTPRIVQQSSSLADQPQQTTPSREVLTMSPHVLSQAIDAFG